MREDGERQHIQYIILYRDDGVVEVIKVLRLSLSSSKLYWNSVSKCKPVQFCIKFSVFILQIVDWIISSSTAKETILEFVC